MFKKLASAVVAFIFVTFLCTNVVGIAAVKKPAKAKKKVTAKVTKKAKKAAVKSPASPSVKAASKPSASPVVLSKSGQIYGSTDAAKPIILNTDVYVKADNVTLQNLTVNGTITLDPGSEGTSYLSKVTAKTIKVLSGATSSIHITDVKADSLDVNSSSNVRIEADGDTVIQGTTATGYTIFDKKSGAQLGTITITAGPNGKPQIEFVGTITDKVIVETDATVVTSSDSSVQDLTVSPTAENAQVSLSGNFTNVEVSKPAALTVMDNTKITGTLKVSASAAITAAATSSVPDVSIQTESATDTVTLSGTLGKVNVLSNAAVQITSGANVATLEVAPQVSTPVKNEGTVGTTVNNGNGNVAVNGAGGVSAPGGVTTPTGGGSSGGGAPSGGGSTGGGGSNSSSPLINSLTANFSDSGSVSGNGIGSSTAYLDLSGVDATKHLSSISISTSRTASNLIITSFTKSNLDHNITVSSNSIPVSQLLAAGGYTKDKVSIGALRLYFGSTLTIRGTFTDASNSQYTLTVKLTN